MTCRDLPMGDLSRRARTRGPLQASHEPLSALAGSGGLVWPARMVLFCRLGRSCFACSDGLVWPARTVCARLREACSRRIPLSKARRMARVTTPFTPRSGSEGLAHGCAGRVRGASGPVGWPASRPPSKGPSDGQKARAHHALQQRLLRRSKRGCHGLCPVSGRHPCLCSRRRGQCMHCMRCGHLQHYGSCVLRTGGVVDANVSSCVGCGYGRYEGQTTHCRVRVVTPFPRPFGWSVSRPPSDRGPFQHQAAGGALDPARRGRPGRVRTRIAARKDSH